MEQTRVETMQGDPDPFTIAALAMTAVSAAAGLVNFIIQAKRSRREQDEARRRVRETLAQAFTAFRKSKEAFERFISYLDKLEFLKTRFIIGSPHIVGNKPVLDAFNEIRETFLDSVRKLSEVLNQCDRARRGSLIERNAPMNGAWAGRLFLSAGDRIEKEKVDGRDLH